VTGFLISAAKFRAFCKSSCAEIGYETGSLVFYSIKGIGGY